MSGSTTTSNAQSLMASLMSSGGGGGGGGDDDLFFDAPPAAAASVSPAALATGGGGGVSSDANVGQLVVPAAPAAAGESVVVTAATTTDPIMMHGASAPPMVPAPPAAAPPPVVASHSPPSTVPASVAPRTVPAAPAPSSAATSSLLMQSGLLGTAAAVGPAHGLGGGGGGGGGGGLFDDIDEQEALRQKKQREEQERQVQLQRQQEEAAAAAAAAAAVREKQEQLQRQQLQQQQMLQQQQQQQQQQQMYDQMQSIHLGPDPVMKNPQQQQQPGMIPSQPGYTSSQQQPQQQGIPPPQQQPGMSPSPRQQQQQQPGMSPPPPPQQQHQQQPAMQAGFYREHPPAATNGGYASPQQHPSGGMQQQQQQQQVRQGGRYYQNQTPPTVTAGMHNGLAQQQALGRAPPALLRVTRPREIQPLYGKVTVSEPLLVQSPSILGIGQAPHWSYQVTTQVKAQPGMQQQQQGCWLVRRRFRHVVALEERLREECPGAILPPRPDKHATRALEEASAQQSAEFALHRATELQVYLNELVQHPVCYQSHVLRLFLALQDDLGTAWPEVSNNALTRFANSAAGAAVKVSESAASTSNSLLAAQPGGGVPADGLEPDATLLALQSSEQLRMGAVLQSVPKLEGAVTLLREQAELHGAVGMELNRLAKEFAMEVTPERDASLELLSAGMLRQARRSKRLVQECSAALSSFSVQYKTCRYERLAFADRRAAMLRRSKERNKADQRAAQLVYQQRAYQQQQFQNQGHMQQPLDRMQHDAVVSDQMATDAGRECEEIGERLKSEVNRIAYHRRTAWNAAVKVVASAMKEACTERRAIWESVQDNFLSTFPEYRTAAPASLKSDENNAAAVAVGGGGAVTSNGGTIRNT